MSAMLCPKCGGKTDVKESHPTIGKGSIKETPHSLDSMRIRRRRSCRECGNKFTTYELTKHHYDELALIKRTLRINQAKEGSK